MLHQTMDSSEQLADDSSSENEPFMNVIEPPISSPKKRRVVTFNLVPKYLEYQNAISDAPKNGKYKKENHEKNIEKDNLLKRLALKPSFLDLSPALNNLQKTEKR
uniref:Uncharacterized protein n=1 Tax=Globodera pallida TaxID=36090 RepID=A0A183CG58_GLOPA